MGALFVTTNMPFLSKATELRKSLNTYIRLFMRGMNESNATYLRHITYTAVLKTSRFGDSAYPWHKGARVRFIYTMSVSILGSHNPLININTFEYGCSLVLSNVYHSPYALGPYKYYNAFSP